MFAKTLHRAPRPSVSVIVRISTCSSSNICTASISAAPRSLYSHSRRHSSSKTSFPPGGPSGSEPANNGTASAPAEEPKRSTGRVTRRKGRDAASEMAMKAKDEAFVNLPYVPPTNLQPQDIKLSTFFSLHRPLSTTTPIPPPVTRSTFNSIFEPRPLKSKTEDTIYTLSSAVSTLESSFGQSVEEKDLRWELLNGQRSEGDNGQARTQRLEQFVKQFTPFNIPPVPVPFDEAVAAAETKKAHRQHLAQQPSEKETVRHDKDETAQVTSHKQYKTTLIINKATSANGDTAYTFSNTPIVEQDTTDDHATQGPQISHASEDKSNFYTIRAPGSVERSRSPKQMLLISVKRRRKLKMKKHKYKKLMKRTRNLRRREGRL